MGRRVAIIGTGQTYHKSHRADVTSREMVYEAVTRALRTVYSIRFFIVISDWTPYRLPRYRPMPI